MDATWALIILSSLYRALRNQKIYPLPISGEADFASN